MLAAVEYSTFDVTGKRTSHSSMINDLFRINREYFNQNIKLCFKNIHVWEILCQIYIQTCRRFFFFFLWLCFLPLYMGSREVTRHEGKDILWKMTQHSFPARIQVGML